MRVYHTLDLSLRNLSYVAIKTNELAFSNIEYAQTDLMEVGQFKRQFDLIKSGSAPHHLSYQLAGQKVLVNLLKPEG